MQNYKEVCCGYKEVWFEIQLGERKKFLKWAKSLGCVWLDGTEIDPFEEIKFTHFSVDIDGKLGIVPISAWVSKQPEFKNVKRCFFN